jgi:hypothetical protein
MKKIRFVCAIALCAIFNNACKQSNNVTFTYEQRNLEFLFEPPYAGSDTKAAEVNLNLDSAFAANKANLQKISKVNLENVTFQTEDGKTFDNFSGLTVEFQSDNQDVKTITVGSINEMEKGKKELTFAGSEKQNADDFFKQKKFNILLSSNMKTEDTLAYKIKGSLKFKVAAAKN